MALLAGTAIVAAGALAPVRAQTLEQAMATAYATNPQLVAQRAQLRSADESVAQARSGWRPTVTVNGSVGENQIDSQGATSPTTLHPKSAGLTITQPLFRGFRTILGTARATNQVKAERARLFVQEQNVLLAVAQAYLDVLQNAAVVELNVSNEQVLRRQLEATQDRFRVGEVTRTDVSQAEAALAGAIAARISAEGALITSRQVFEQQVGMQPRGLVAPAVPPNLPKTIDDAAAAASNDNPNVIAALFDEGAAREQVGEIRGQLLPTLQAVGTVSTAQETSTTGSTSQNYTNSASVVLQLQVPLYEAGSVYSQVRAARQVDTQRQITIEVNRRQVIQQATSAFQNLQTARASISSLAAQVRAAEIAEEGVRQEAAVGSRTVLDVLNAVQAVLNAQVSYVRAQHDDLVAAYQLLSASGRLGARQLKLPVELYDYEANYNDVEHRWFGTDILGDN